MKPISMVDLQGQYYKIKQEVLAGIESVIERAAFINGPEVQSFATELEAYLQVNTVIPCANGTDALQVALMALDLQPGDEVIIPSFNYVALAEVTALLGLKPVFVDVDPLYYTLDPEAVKAAIGPKTKVLAVVHLFGQCAPMEALLAIAADKGLYVIEDNAQAIGANYTFSDGRVMKAGTMGHIGTTSFFPSKNLGCYGDGGAIFTPHEDLGKILKAIANHGQSVKYVHDRVGVNSRLDTLQAAILRAKLPHLESYNAARLEVANFYDQAFASLYPVLQTPQRAPYSSHVFHQYTLKLSPHVDREALRAFLAAKQIPTMVYYPIPLHQQQAYLTPIRLTTSEMLASQVISLPISTEMDTEQLHYITEAVHAFMAQQRA
jgi:UDP-2-acetamido-2-deoxy-ribo-hexuluronate aminotransferase